MERKAIAIEKFTVQAYGVFEVQWMLLTCGNFEQKTYNSMTISWGSLGVIWNKPFAQVVVRPVRYTFEFMERFDSFTLCAFPKQYRNKLSLLGTKSGKEIDKIQPAGLTPIAATCVAAPAYAEAELVIECRKMYWQDLDPSHFLDASIERNYPLKDYHRSYYGEILAVQATPQYGL